jgi:hypothetical protein
MHLLSLVNYEDKYLNVRNRPFIPIIDEAVPEEVRSLFFPLLLICTAVLLLRRRTKVIIDESAMRRLAAENLLYGDFIKRYRRVYMAADVPKDLLRLDEFIFSELKQNETDAVEDMAEKYSISVEDAKSLFLCKKLRAKKFITGAQLPEEVAKSFKGTKIVSVDEETGFLKAL